LPKKADTNSEIDQKGAQVRDDRDAIIQIDWTWSSGEKAGQTTKNTWIYFQEGALIEGLKPNATTFVLGRYSKSGNVAASLSKYGDGWVGLMGPHPEATQSWCEYDSSVRSRNRIWRLTAVQVDEYGLSHPDGLQFDIGYDFVEAAMAGGPENATRPSGSQNQGQQHREL
jgi:hypothetical protein